VEERIAVEAESIRKRGGWEKKVEQTYKAKYQNPSVDIKREVVRVGLLKRDEKQN